MKAGAVVRGSVLPVLYIGRDLTPAVFHLLRAHRIGVVVAEDTRRARRLLTQFQVSALVFAAPDLQGLRSLIDSNIPVVVLAARDAVCDLDAVTIVRRDTNAEDLAAILHGVARDRADEPARTAA